MTGIQALERLNRKKLAQPGDVEKQKFEYIRHGTQTLIAKMIMQRTISLKLKFGALRYR